MIREFFSKLFLTKEYKEEIDYLKKMHIEADKRLDKLARATVDGDEQWFIRMVKKSPSCAITKLTECDDVAGPTK